MEKKEQEVAEEYLSSLADLNLNSKPLINMLTILAEENIEYAPTIVKAVEHHIAKVNPDVKLPVLYLIDSIVKNVGREYIQLFSHSIVNIFCGVFEKVNEKIREKMYTLRQTWNDVFAPHKLYTLDVKVNCMDPNWPITAKVAPKSPAIHVNPNFLKNKGEPLNEMEAKLRDKQRQLLELQKRKLELELAATKQRLEEQEKQLQSTIQGEGPKPINPAGVAIPAPTAPVPNKPLLGPMNKTVQQKMMPAAAVNFPGLNPNAPKIRVAPVNSALLNSIRQRDPRLVRQQQQQAAALAAANELAIASSAAADATSGQMTSAPGIETQGNERKDVTVDRSIPKISQKTAFTMNNREKSKTMSSSIYNDNSIGVNSNLSNKRSAMHRGGQDKSSLLDGKKSPVMSVQLSPSSSHRSSGTKNHSSSTSRSGNGSRGSGRDNSRGQSIRDKLSGYERERKRKVDSSPNKNSDRVTSPLKSDKSPKRHGEHSMKSKPMGSTATNGPGSPSKFKEAGKAHVKSRNYMRRNREKSASPAPPTPPPPTTSSQDTDLREPYLPPSALAEKRTKIARTEIVASEVPADNSTSNGSISITSTTITSAAVASSKVGDSAVNTTAPSSSVSTSVTSSNGKPEKLEKNLDMMAPMDIDLRQLHASQPSVVKPATVTGTGSTNAALDSPNCSTPSNADEAEDAESKKRSATENLEEPAVKKSKSEKIDSLFGTEDVDLRTLSAPGGHMGVVGVHSVMPSTPPPPPIISNESENWAKVKGNKSSSRQSSKSRLDDVRAKLAKAAKGEKFERDLKSIRKASRFNEAHEDSQDGTDNNIRTIISQAQEMLQSDNMDFDQYNTLVKTVIQINETSKLKEAQRRESLLTKKEDSHDLTPISDEEVHFSSEDESGTKASRSKVLAKRIPKITKKDENSTTEDKFEQSSVLRRSPSPTNDNSNSYSDDNRNPSVSNQTMSKFEKRGRQKGIKWNHWDQNALPLQNHKPKWFMGNNNFRPSIPQKVGNMNNPPNMMNRSVPNPWQTPPQIVFAGPLTQSQIPPPPPIPPMVNPVLPPDVTTVTPGPPIPPPILLPPLSNSVDNPNADVVRTINIDGVPKEIRFYDEIAIAFMDWDQPKEIGFQAGQRRIMVDDHDMISLSFNDVYKTVTIDGNPHQMRFGCPTRELYVDGNWFECYFGDPPIRIFLDGRLRVFKIEGPAPQVRIGNTRQDLVVGKINMIIDALIIVPVFLDAKVQTFPLDDTVHTLQFADCLKTVLIDNVPFDVEYGGLPKSMLVNGVKHFVRFGTLPNGVTPGAIDIQNMIRTEKFKTETPLPGTESNQGSTATASISTPFQSDVAIPALNTNAPDTNPSIASNKGGENDGSDVKPTGSVPPALPGAGNFNIDELFQKLLTSGILNQNQGVPKQDEIKKDKTKDSQISPVDLSRPETIKARQGGLIQKLFTGMQCSSCGVRFPPEQTMKYSQHLDWHFRQNRKERDNSRRAHSRKWYYDVSDWIQYEEIEDLEEREKNWFEAQQNEAENVDENSNQRTNSPPPSCPAGPDNVDKCCDMCHDKFEQFYNEESEEWHLRDAIRVEDKTYHPICYEDFKASLLMDESLPPAVETDDNATDAALVKSEKDESESERTTQVIDDDDDEDDVIVLPAEEPSIQEIPDDDEDVIIETSLENAILVPDSENSIDKGKSNKDKDIVEAMESDDVQIQEPNIPFTDLDTYEETALPSVSTVDDSSQSSQMVVKIKEEPKDDGYNEDDEFEEVGTIICDDDISLQASDVVTVISVSPTPAAPKPAVTSSSNSNILVLHDPASGSVNDGNLDTHDAPASTVQSVNKIKINISKSAIRAESNANASSRVEIVEENSSSKDNATKLAEEDDFYNSIKYTLKPSLQNVQFKKVPRNIRGVDTSGLCSIM